VGFLLPHSTPSPRLCPTGTAALHRIPPAPALVECPSPRDDGLPALGHFASIFYALVLSVNYSVDGGPTDFTVDGVGWSPLGLIISIAIGAALVLLLWLVCFLSKIPGGMPVARSCSAAISAACHGPEWDEEVPQKLLAWGVVGRGVAEGTQHTAFSSGDVQPLSEGGIYT
jgi:hypothetical protein